MVIDIAGADPGKKYDFFLRKIVIFHTKYPQKNCVSLCSAQFFKVHLPLTLNPGTAPALCMH
jgi:hypothetical protein